ncbi:hypothetical protein BD309DRAFT_888566 [Dichomitus squalens]|uniref:Uncharacterized protein n=2 Tax=Dichomitus squalens TaxID=114155 RepID=A0A4Q9MY40_9APHY|nr:uncharacterized protein DICSQDRAFT_169312 [Dichomitus squalens LYAD-421 SS1]EJF62282.1 hypothetical protein DICSQDRAFT_169312 [Dichomitus squalens LYAD-421 SS1]TBU32990.1 hypothetical protein BD311DRAFT_794366 [Dichomitus squalens]TBU46370.1 hypothetical protein BD309DRAFT_888566 [Dichomitus squalens]TBU63274.1 hypothetical protein BD310DRAFT_917140 [Dichomitus squalens]
MHPAVRRLERIPPEIWQEIIAFACTDGGATGRSIALTCRFFREQSLHVRFTSLSFKNTTRLLVFLVSLRVQPKDCKPRIQHVALEPSLYTGHIPRALRHLAGNPQPGQEVDPVDLCANAVEALFSLAARQLRTLCLVANASSAVPFRYFVHAFPKLEELSAWNHPLCPPPATGAHEYPPGHAHAHTLPGSPFASPGSPGGARGMDTDDRQEAGVLLPAMKRFHYVLTEPGMSFKNVLASLPALASHKLTHLRLSGLTSADEDVPRILADILGVPAPMPLRERVRLGITGSSGPQSHSPLDTSGARFPNLRHVVLYAIQPGRDDMQSFPRWATLLGLLRELERTCKRVVGMRMVVLERSWMRKSRWATRLKDDWLQRMEGGRGCWVESEVEESIIEGPLEAPKGVEW